MSNLTIQPENETFSEFSLSPEERIKKASLLAEKLARLSSSEYVARQQKMIHGYKLLETQRIQAHTPIHHPEAQDHLITLDSPALNLLTDFKSAPVETTHPETLVTQALNEMKAAKTKSLIVVNDEGEFLGLVSLKDLQGVRAARMAQSHGISPVELTIAEVMSPAEKLEAIEFKILINARVGHIAKILHEHDLQHLLVIDHDEIGTSRIRGIFSANRIARQLGIDTPLGTLSSHTMGDMNRNLS
jgi:CBS domain-containing protein